MYERKILYNFLHFFVFLTMLKFFFVTAFVFCLVYSTSENATNFNWDEIDKLDKYLGVPPSMHMLAKL